MQLEGKKLGGRYEIISRLGGGGMAVVYKALDHSLGRYVALKILSESLSNDNEFVRRFSREAQAAASLSHPNVVNVYDVGKDGYTYYIVMEIVEGPTLKQYIQQKGVVPTDEAALIAIRICDGLAHAHENQIIHRDIKPHNILLDQKGGRVKVTDFGIARAASSSTITQKGAVMGSVHYFSPEQARGGLTGEKSDIYSLGIVMYEMLTGQLPFDGDQAISIALMHLQNPVTDPRQINPNIPDNFAKILLRALEKDPEMRYTSVRAMMKDIQSALRMLPRNQAVNTDDLFMTVPMLDEDDTSYSPQPTPNTSGSASAAASEERSSFPSKEADPWNQRNQAPPRHFQTPPSRSNGGASSFPEDSKDLTIFQKTAIWFDNAQEKLSVWQKILFGAITVVLILGLTVFGFDKLMGLFSGSDDAPETSTKPKTEQTTGQKEEDAEMVPVKNYVGEWQSRVENYASGSLEENGYKILVSNSLCYNKDLTGSGLAEGKIVAQIPEANSQIKKGDTVKVWVYVNKSTCNKAPQ
ncbi:Stk1 family PASTA domain-containing Ser/Thr kinase [Risungbinella massiliensis]|uniref:Stk1 family PASTA domain-containing Ser/Thr kinase n=1 Tax=Risungbinella massiliensis TaxID=1329796 RepID=UPI0006998C3D|nr:Stk1 family PASTA domain-containing Ser/Thr kinase [Risungbinella massiliensis]